MPHRRFLTRCLDAMYYVVILALPRHWKTQQRPLPPRLPFGFFVSTSGMHTVQLWLQLPHTRITDDIGIFMTTWAIYYKYVLHT